jgi:hypothetical protein
MSKLHPVALTATLGLFLLAGTAATPAWAKTVAAPGKTIAAQPGLFTTVPASGDIRSGTVTVELGLLSENPKWEMRNTVVPVLVKLISDSTVRAAGPTDNLWKHMKARQKEYRGLTIRLRTEDGHAIQPLRVFKGRIATESGRLLSPDAGRQVEFWLFGTARIKGDQQLGGRVMPVLTFDECRVMGNPIVDTKPRQCLLPDDGIMLESDDKPTLKSLKAVDFDSCLLHGQSLIYTFPRRCVAAGGRVFTEPPRVYEPVNAHVSATVALSATTPPRKVIKNKNGKPVAPISSTTPVSSTQIETVPGVGTYAVSPGVPSATAVVSGAMPLTVTVSATVQASVTVVPSPTLPISPAVPAPVAISLPLSTSVVVSSVLPVAVSSTISASVVVSTTPVVPVVSPTVSPTAGVSSFDVSLGPKK